MPIQGARYRYKKGTNIRLAFKGKGTVVEAKNMASGKIHTPDEFARERKMRKRLHDS